jgi:hypothetical protein
MDLVAELSRPRAYGAGVTEVELRETHISWVFLTRDRAFKIKKPVTFAFLDYGTLERRRVACEREVALNRRMAADLYVGVRALVATDDGGIRIAPAEARDAVEYAVEMRRFREQDTLAARIATGTASADDLRAVGAWLAEFHASADVIAGRGAEAVKRTLDDTFASLLGLGRPVPGLERFTAAFLAASAQLLDARAEQGLVCDGHGDLRAEHVLLRESGPAAVDCVEFSDPLRRIDVGEDLSFLVMDLIRLAREDLGEPLLAGYREAGGDPGADSLVAFHAACRALVRAKVAGLRERQLAPMSRERALTAAEADALLDLASRLAWRARQPVIVAVAGVPASGKSTLARALARTAGLPVLESDEVRKQLAGVAPTARASPDLYDRAHDDSTYAELIRRASDLVASSGGVIVAATFRHARHRGALAEAAERAGARLRVIECLVPRSELLERAASRAAEGHDVSDAGPSVVERHLRYREPFEDLPAHVHLPLRADRPVTELICAVEDALDADYVAVGAQELPAQPAGLREKALR